MSSSNLLLELHTDLSRGRSVGLVFPPLEEFSTVCCDPHSQRLWRSQESRSRCFSGTLLLFLWSSGCWQFDLWFICLFLNPAWIFGSSQVLFIIGDWNAKVGSQDIPGVTGKFGLGVQNEAGQRLIEFCQENALVIANTLFQHTREDYTWTSPDGQYQNQIDYILCSQRRRSSIQSAKTRLGADCGSDHELLIAKFRLKLKKIGTNTGKE